MGDSSCGDSNVGAGAPAALLWLFFGEPAVSKGALVVLVVARGEMVTTVFVFLVLALRETRGLAGV